MDDSESAKKETPAAEKREGAKKPDVKKPDDARKKKTDEDAAKNAKENACQKKADEDAVENDKEDADKKKAEEDAAAKKPESKRHEDLNNHMAQPLYMHIQAGHKFMKDNSDLGTNGKVVYIPGLYYETMEVLLEEVCRIVMADCALENVTYTNNIVTARVSFEWKKGTLKFLSFDKYFFNQLGLIRQHVQIASKPLYYSQSGVTVNRRAWLDDVQTVYIYSEGIDYQIVGN